MKTLKKDVGKSRQNYKPAGGGGGGGVGNTIYLCTLIRAFLIRAKLLSGTS